MNPIGKASFRATERYSAKREKDKDHIVSRIRGREENGEKGSG